MWAAAWRVTQKWHRICSYHRHSAPLCAVDFSLVSIVCIFLSLCFFFFERAFKTNMLALAVHIRADTGCRVVVWPRSPSSNPEVENNKGKSWGKKGGKKVFSYWLPLAPISTEGRKAHHLRANQSESCGREPGTVQPVLFTKHTPPN